MRYKIEISMNPNYEDNLSHPYFWIIRSIDENNDNSGWCTVNAGWAKTPKQAWQEASEYHEDITSI